MRVRAVLVLLVVLAVVLLIWASGEAATNTDPWKLIREFLRSRGIEVDI